MKSHHKEEKQVVATWWSYDSETNMLYYEHIEDDKPVLAKTHTYFYCESEIGDGWIVASEENEGANISIVLWNNDELAPGKELVAEVINWSLCAIHHSNILENYTFGINTAVIDGRQPWVWEEGLPEVILRGHYRDGGFFEDPIRLIIPLQSGGMVAIGKSRARRYFLHTVSSAVATTATA